MPKTAPKYLRISADIERRLQANDWAGRLPGLRELAEEYGTSTLTMSRSVQLLRDKGLIGRVDNSGCHLATATPPPPDVWAVHLQITPGEWHTVSNSSIKAGIDAVAALDRMRFVDPFGGDRAAADPDQNRDRIRDVIANGAQGLIMLPSRVDHAGLAEDEAILAACKEEGLPVVLLERNLLGHDRPLEHDLICVDDFVGGAACTRHLIEQGRRKIVAVVASPCSSHDSRAAGYYHALRLAEEANVPVAPPRVFVIPPGLDKKEVDHWVAGQVVQCEADGVFCYQDSLAVGLIMDLFSRGRSVPGDVAVVGYDNLPIGNLFNLGVTTYRYPAEQLVRNAIRMLRHRFTAPEEPPVKVCVPGELIVRKSSLSNPATQPS